MNTYAKYCPNVFLAKCTEKHDRGAVIPVTTQYGKENDSIVFNLIFEKEGFYYYSIVRADGFNAQQRAANKSEKYNNWAASAERRSTEYYDRSNKDRDFLSLGEPIKIGHHSEGRHRRAIEQANNNMRKCVELSDISESHESKADYWARRAKDINLSMPESIQYYEFELGKAKAKHEGLKNGTIAREHSFSLTYAKKEVNEISAKLELALKLWS